MSRKISRHFRAHIRINRSRTDQVYPDIVGADFQRHRTVPHGKLGANRISEQMTGAFMRFGSKVLTEREREIAGLILRGHSSKSAARELNIAPETERVHRKRLYSKLGISSHADLFWMFIESFSYFDPESTEDPLQEYLRLRRARAS